MFDFLSLHSILMLLLMFFCHKNEVPAIWSSFPLDFFKFEFQQNKTKPKKKWNGNGNQTWNQENQICECFEFKNEKKKSNQIVLF